MDAVVFDARPYQHEGREPFAYIMKALEDVAAGQPFVLVNTFDPKPLEAVMEARGYAFTVEQFAEDHYVVTFTQTEQARSGEIPVVDRREMAPDKMVFQIAGVLRRMRRGETFVVWVDAIPDANMLNVIKTAGATIEQDSHWTGNGHRLKIVRQHPTS